MKKTIVILDNDVHYAQKIVNYGIKYNGKNFTFIFFTNLSAFEKYQSENHISILIANIDLIDKINQCKAEILFIITNEKNQETIPFTDKIDILEKNKLDAKFIYKYSNAKTIFSTIFSEYYKITDKKDRQDKNSLIYLIFSPIGRCGKTIFSYAFAHELSNNKKILYISLNNYESLGSKTGLSQIIYNFKNNKLTYENVKDQIQTDNNLSILYGVSFPEDFLFITPEDLDRILNEISKIMSYDIIVVDCDNSFVKISYLLKSCDKIILPTLNDEISNRKKKNFLNFIKEQNLFDISKIDEIDMSTSREILNNNKSLNHSIIQKATKISRLVLNEQQRAV